MSSYDPSGHHGEPPHGHGGDGADDTINFGKVITIGVVSLAIFAVATWWASIILRQETTVLQKDGKSRPVDVSRPEIGIVDQVPFQSDTRLDVWKREHAERLNGYGWVDRGRGVAHIPIEKAMEQVAGGALPQGAPR
jgi:hypothetical protein